jgi:hypothetical protein
VLVPQITSELFPAALVTENWSIKQFDAWLTKMPAPVVTWPAVALATESVEVEGPLITNEVKSNLNCQNKTFVGQY